MLYGIEDEEEIIHLLGYLTEDQWQDAFDNYDNRLDKGKLHDYKQVIEKRYCMKINIVED